MSNTPETTPGHEMKVRSRNLVITMQIQNCSSFPVSGKSLRGRTHLQWPERDRAGSRDLLSSCVWSSSCPLDVLLILVFCLDLKSMATNRGFSPSQSLKVYRPIHMEAFEVLCALFMAFKCGVMPKRKNKSWNHLNVSFELGSPPSLPWWPPEIQ